MNLTDQLSETLAILYGVGESMAGCTLTVDDAISWLNTLSPTRPFCLVTSWHWLDLELSEQDRQKVEAAGMQPVVILADNVVFDSRSRFATGHWVRSTLLVEHRDGCLFETRNTRYVLMGEGRRKKTTPAALGRIQ
ncbi:DUF6957 family protein [Metapseudomonas furukawaii]|uniref:DUF6957 family protein n=1 Tax=Metapseudomonas furukawaii TaxID=1149133 RepID=UPI0006850701|nr:hypothetical protein [Pseudomonas furukawaii]